MAPTLPSEPRRRQMRRALLEWHRPRRRSFAFRETSDPYAILVAEIMAQQTQIGRVDPYWRGFLARFPTPTRLAEAPTADVLRAWAGLGHNRRAIHLQRAAREIVARHGGVVPADPVLLETLPGVGPYTARAVAAVAFGLPTAPVDTNVRRVVGRLVAGHGRAGDPGEPLGARALQAASDSLVDRAAAADWVHATMDLGATVCRARPDCGACPLQRWCAYPPLVAAEGPAPAATSGSRPRRRAPAPPFSATRRWLRGRIVERLRDVVDGEWQRLDGSIGEHDPAAVVEAVMALARDGLIERDARGRVRLTR